MQIVTAIKKLFVCVFPISLFALGAGAQEFSIKRSYVLYRDDQKQIDADCLDAFEKNIVTGFRGLRAAELAKATAIDTKEGALLIYSGVQFFGDYGNARGTINCVFGSDKRTLTDVAVDFDGIGLGGFERRGRISASDDPSDWKVTSFSSRILQ